MRDTRGLEDRISRIYSLTIFVGSRSDANVIDPCAPQVGSIVAQAAIGQDPWQSRITANDNTARAVTAEEDHYLTQSPPSHLHMSVHTQ